MKKLTYLLTVFALGLASVVNASVAQDTSVRVSSLESGTAARMVKASYVPPALGESTQTSLGRSTSVAAKSVADVQPNNQEAPQNGYLTLLAGLAIIVVIGKRRMSS